MNDVKVSRIRPVSWNVYVQGREEAQYARSLLSQAGIQTSKLRQQPELIDPPVYVFLATPNDATPMTSVELEAILSRDDRVELVFEKP